MSLAHLTLLKSCKDSNHLEMPDQSCRSCGLSLMRYSICAVCRKVIKHVCVKCGSRTIEQLHTDCFFELYLLKNN